MPSYGSERAKRRLAPPHTLTKDGAEALASHAGPAELAEWIERRLQLLSDRWIRQIGVRRADNGLPDELLESFGKTLVSLLPALVGPHRSQVLPLWSRAAELFGTAAAKAGLAAGEVVEEFQLLREVLIRALYEEPPLGGRVPLSLRDVLHLNRAIDAGVTQASVTHTDQLFFVLLEGSGTTDPEPADELIAEIEGELDGIRGEFVELLGRTGRQGSSRARN